jgi:3-hydroxyisobutyrate dehydrogenase-like beta-hydroxyacid dehydrogenase
MTTAVPETPPTVGVVGLGQMGSLIAGHLVDRPGGLLVHDVRPEAAGPLVERGATAMPAVADLAARADIVSVMVLDDAQVRSVVDELLPTARPGTVVAIHSTIHPQTAVDLAERAAGHGVEVLDAPVSGGVLGATSARLAVMVGGDRASYERCREPFRRWADLILHVGPVGAGTRTKLARNLVGFVGYCAAAEAQRLAESAGLDLGKLGAVVRHTDAITGGPGAVMLRGTTAPLPTDDPLYDVFAHTRVLGEKDLGLAVELGDELGVDVPFARLALDRLAAGLGLPKDGLPAAGPAPEEA